MVRVQRLACVLTASFIVACGASGAQQALPSPSPYNLREPEVVLLSPSVLQFSGPLTPEAVALVAETAPETVTTLRIRSLGGLRMAALDFAELVRARNWSVSVYDFCLSGCAHAVLVAGRTRHIEDGAFLLFHQTDVSLIATMRNHTGDDTLETYMHGAERLLSLYAQSNVDPALLILPLASMETLCETLVFDAFGDVADVRARMRKAAWAGSTRALASFGLTFEGQVPETVEELQARTVAAQLLVVEPIISFLSERQTPEQEQALIARHTATPLCSPPIPPLR